MVVGKKNSVGKRERGSNIIFPTILSLLGRISSGEKDGNFWGKNQVLINGGEEEYQVVGNFIHISLSENK